MKFDHMVEKILQENLASRVTKGTDEIRNILQTGKVTSQGYGGHTFFYNNPDPKSKYLSRVHSPELKPGQKAGYVIKGDSSQMSSPTQGFNSPGTSPDYYKRKNYVTLPPDSSASNIKTFQRIKAPASHWEQPSLGKERSFDRFQKLYSRLIDAYKSGRIQARPPRITGSGAGGALALMAFVNSEVPPDQRNAMMGGLGIKGKFEATP